MSELALCCRRSRDTAEMLAVYCEYTSRAGLVHVLGYLGGRLGTGIWRSERVVVERTSEESVALVTEMGDWSAGSNFVRRSSHAGYQPAERSIIGPIDSDVDDRIYELVSRWVYWENGILHLRLEDVGSQFSNSSVEIGPIDATTVSELQSIWLFSAASLG